MFAPGSRLGSYEITGKLGAGGMGEVYRATDTKLRRDVAIKVLPAAFTQDKERLARFEREAQLLAQLHHPNIASIFGIEDADGVRALVMELVEGPTLADRLEAGALPVEECLAIARQIADALEAAHEKGIVHRDLKPQNIKASIDGPSGRQVKVLDFGLAKAMDPAGSGVSGGSGSQVAQSPTMTLGATEFGVILGTAAYMAPEQAKGLAVDKRGDIWAFGVVLHEMLTGERLFAGDTVPETLAAVIRSDIDLARLPVGTPPAIRRLLRRCLERNPKNRLRDIGDARLVLEELASGRGDEGGSGTSLASTSMGSQPTSLARRRPWGALLATVAAILAAGIAWISKPEAPTPTQRLSIALPPGERITTAPAISPDGQTIAYVAGRSTATSRLYLRGLNEFAARAVDSSREATWPVFSPDGRAVAYFSQGSLWRAPVRGGAPVVIAPAPRGFGVDWGDDGYIVYVPSLDRGLWRVPATGGEPEQMTEPDQDASGYAHVFPQVLPGGEVLFSFWGKTFYTGLLSPATKTWRAVTSPRNRVATWVGGRFLVRGDESADLLATRWNPSQMTPPQFDTVVLGNVNWQPGTDQSWISVSTNGTAVYAPGDPNRRELVWVDRGGRMTVLPGEADQISFAVLSRDGERILHNGRNSLWVRDLASGTRTRIAEVQRTFAGGWLPGDERVVVSSNHSGDWDLYAIRASGGELEPLLRRPRTQHPATTAPDGSIVFYDYDARTGIDIWKLSPEGEASPLVTSPFRDGSPRVSSDGRFLAYASDEAGRFDVYVIPFSGAGDRVMVSVDGGTGPVWSRDGRELFYRSGDHLISAAVESTSPLRFGTRRTLLDVSAFESQYFSEFEVSADGQRFLFIRAEPDARPTRLDVVLNWFPELEEKVPVN